MSKQRTRRRGHWYTPTIGPLGGKVVIIRPLRVTVRMRRATVASVIKAPRVETAELYNPGAELGQIGATNADED